MLWACENTCEFWLPDIFTHSYHHFLAESYLSCKIEKGSFVAKKEVYRPKKNDWNEWLTLNIYTKKRAPNETCRSWIFFIVPVGAGASHIHFCGAKLRFCFELCKFYGKKFWYFVNYRCAFWCFDGCSWQYDACFALYEWLEAWGFGVISLVSCVGTDGNYGVHRYVRRAEVLRWLA